MPFSFPANRWFSLFVLFHLLAWTAVPALVRYNLPLDAIEGTIWGHQLEWGYDKNPFLNGWLTALAVYLGGPSGWMVYLFSQLSVITCFWVVWQLGNRMLSPAYALIAVMLLECTQYYNLHAIDFNDNTLELGLWGLTIWFFYCATRKETYRDWILTGLFAGLAMMAKYYTLALLAGMALFILVRPENRKQLASLPPYLGLLTFCAVMLPHVIWLFYHDFITVNYVFARASSQPHWTNHFFFPAQFAWQQGQVFLPALILFAFVLFPRKTSTDVALSPLSAFNHSFLLYVGLAPFLLTVILSLCSGIKLRAGWGMPLLSLWGIILVASVQPHLSTAKLYRFISAIFILMGVLLTGYALSLINSSDASSANFPGREVAQVITQKWSDTFHTPLRYVAGSRWIGGNIGFYSADHPAVFIEWDHQRAPWINTRDLLEKGAVFVWDLDGHENLPDEIRAAYPQLRGIQILEFQWKRNRHGLAPARVGIALLPPRDVARKLS